MMSFVEDWCNKQRLSVILEETTLAPFTKKINLNQIRDTFLYQEKLKLVGKVKYLGITVGKTLTYKTHFEDKFIKALWTFGRAISTKWSLRPTVAHWIYNLRIILIIIYEFFV